MAKRHQPTEELNIPNDAETPVTPKWRYIGPPYDLGIKLHRVSTMFRPAAFSDEEVDAFLEKYPECGHWWLPNDKL